MEYIYPGQSLKTLVKTGRDDKAYEGFRKVTDSDVGLIKILNEVCF